MATERIEINGSIQDNIGGGYLLNLFYIDTILPTTLRPRKRQVTQGLPAALDRLSIKLSKIQIDLKGKMVVKNGAEMWEYTLSAEVPRNQLDRLQAMYNATRRKFFCAFFTHQTTDIPLLPQQRVIGWVDNPCRFSFEELHGQKMDDFNHYKFEITCTMPKPAPYVVTV